MSGIKLTTGEGFEGYEIVEYLGVVNGQIALSSNFFKDFSTNIAELSMQESAAFTNRLENASGNAIENLIKVAEQKGANAIIGIELNYATFSNNSIGTVASGTAVVIRQKEKKHKIITEKFNVMNYYNVSIPRPVEITLTGENNQTQISALFYNYNQEIVRAVRCDIELVNYYEEKLMLQGIDFVFLKNDIRRLETELVECRLPMKAIPLVKEVKVYVKKYVTSRGVFVPDTETIDITLSKRAFEMMRLKSGEDAVEHYKTDNSTWICNCGHINTVNQEECSVCGRKELSLRSNVGFDYEKMCRQMQGLPSVAAMKEVLMIYIKEGMIDSKYRMELLEIMESGMQYERTRGDMRGSILEKIMGVFEK